MTIERSPGTSLSDRLRAQIRALQPAKGEPDLGPLLGTIARLASRGDPSLGQRTGMRPIARRSAGAAENVAELRTMTKASEVADRLRDASELEAVLSRLREACFAEPVAAAAAHRGLSLDDSLALLAAPDRDEAVCSAAFRTLVVLETPGDRLASRVLAGASAALQRAAAEPSRARLARALALVSVLRSSVDEVGQPELGRDLRRLYDYCLDRVFVALVAADASPLADAERAITTLQAAMA